jgi:hypothetical protein
MTAAADAARSLDAELEAAVRHLAAIERPSASDGEREAAEWIAAALQSEGCRARIEEERAHGGFWWPIGLLSAVAAGAAALSARRRSLGALLALGVLAALFDDLDHRTRWFRRLLPQRSTWNVVAEAGDPGATRTVLLTAHHDAAHGGAIFDPRAMAWFARRFPERHARAAHWPRIMRLVMLGPLLVAAGAGLRRRSLSTAGAVASAASAGVMADIGLRKVVPGANDNLTSVAVLLALARALRRQPLRGLRVVLVSTGSEESNSEGMQAFGRRHFASLPRETTDFIVLETLGSGRLAAAESEGFLVHHDYPDDLKALASECARELGIELERGLRIVFATDAQLPLHAGYRTMVLGSINELKVPANYHKPSDVADNVDYACVADAARLAEAMVRRLAGDDRQRLSARS